MHIQQEACKCHIQHRLFENRLIFLRVGSFRGLLSRFPQLQFLSFNRDLI